MNFSTLNHSSSSNFGKKASLSSLIIFLIIILLLGGMVYFSFFGQGSTIEKIITLVSSSLVFITGLFLLYWNLFYPPNRLRSKLVQLGPLLSEEPAEKLKENYLEIYSLYLKLSETHKQNFYGRIEKLRQTIEEQLKIEKKLEELFQKITTLDLPQQKQVYLEIYQYYQKLPQKMQGYYYPQIIQLREQLEKGQI